MGADCAVVAARSARAHGVDDRRVISGIVHVLRSGARWCDCRLPTEIGDDECEALAVLALTPGRGVAPGRPLVEQAVLLQALQNMADGAALEFERFRQRQDRAVVALAGCEASSIALSVSCATAIAALPPPTAPPANRSGRAGRGSAHRVICRSTATLALAGKSSAKQQARRRRTLYRAILLPRFALIVLHGHGGRLELPANDAASQDHSITNRNSPRSTSGDAAVALSAPFAFLPRGIRVISLRRTNRDVARC
jgi:hypothetical protein